MLLKSVLPTTVIVKWSVFILSYELFQVIFSPPGYRGGGESEWLAFHLAAIHGQLTTVW